MLLIRFRGRKRGARDATVPPDLSLCRNAHLSFCDSLFSSMLFCFFSILFGLWILETKEKSPRKPIEVKSILVKVEEERDKLSPESGLENLKMLEKKRKRNEFRMEKFRRFTQNVRIIAQKMVSSKTPFRLFLSCFSNVYRSVFNGVF